MCQHGQFYTILHAGVLPKFYLIKVSAHFLAPVSGEKEGANMARIRTIKPEFWEDEKIARLSITAKLLFIGIWNFADDGGVCRATPGYLKSRIFLGEDSVSIRGVLDALSEISREGLITVGDYNGESFLLVKNWHLHQKVEKPSKKKVLSIPYENEKDYSGRAHRLLTDQSVTDRDRDRDKEEEIVIPNGITSAVPLRKRNDPGGCLEELNFSEAVKALVDPVPHKVQQTWLELYPEPDFLRRELLAMVGWCATNPHKSRRTARGWSTFIGGWLRRSWDGYQRALPSQKPVIDAITLLKPLSGGGSHAGA
jgi:hypothetical protein